MPTRKALIACITGALALCLPLPAFAAESGYQKQKRKEVEIPHCARSLGYIAIHEPDTDWWTKMELGSPTAIIKVFVQQSGCFKLVDRGAGMKAAEEERAYAARGTLRKGSNIGAGQVHAADFVLIPDLVTHNQNGGGNMIGGILGSFIPGVGGAIASGINFKSKTATVTLALTDVRSSEQLAVVQGHAKKTDVGWGGGAAGFGTTGFGAVGAGSYMDTEAGQIIALAYLDAYVNLVKDRGGSIQDAPAVAASAPQQAVTMARPGRLYADASIKSKVVRPLDAGELLYPTGKQSDDGAWREVQDEVGTTGWVSSLSIQLAKK